MARRRPGGVNLGLDEAELWWQGYSGMSLLEVTKKLDTLRRIGEEPDAILIHCGGNDIGRVPIKRLRSYIDILVKHLRDNFRARIIWSEILPRNVWRYSDNRRAMESARLRLNNYAANRFIANEGFYVKHPDLQEVAGGCYVEDGVHLTLLGNCILLNQWASAVDEFRAKGSVCFK